MKMRCISLGFSLALFLIGLAAATAAHAQDNCAARPMTATQANPSTPHTMLTTTWSIAGCNRTIPRRKNSKPCKRPMRPRRRHARPPHRHRHRTRRLLPARRRHRSQHDDHQELHHSARPYRRPAQGGACRQSRQQGRRFEQRLHSDGERYWIYDDEPDARELLQSGLRVSRRPVEESEDALAGDHASRRLTGRRRQARLFARRAAQPARHHVHPHHPLLFHARLH